MLFLWCFASPPRRPKRRPSGPKTPPRAPQEAPRGRQERPRRPQEEPKRPQEPVKRAQDPPRSPQKAPKEHLPKDNCANQCCRYRRDRRRQKTFSPRCSRQGTGGRRCSPLGEAIRRTPRRGEVTACQIASRRCRVGQRCQDLCKSCLHIAADRLWRSFFTPLESPQEGCAFRRSGPRGA